MENRVNDTFASSTAHHLSPVRVVANECTHPETRAFLSHALLALTVTVVANLRQS